jgi:hypothetical protein
MSYSTSAAGRNSSEIIVSSTGINSAGWRIWWAGESERCGTDWQTLLNASEAVLRGLVRECIECHVDQHQLQILRTAEESERELLKKWAAIHAGRL